jgi:hypothetical protein
MDADGHSTRPQVREGTEPSTAPRRPGESRPSPSARKLLAIYLSDHHAGSTMGLELAKRAASHNAGSRIGVVLDDIVREIAADRKTLERLMDVLEVRTSPVKRAGAFVSERLARLKTNGRLFSYSPLSRVVELEGLALGILGKQALWEGLADVPALEGIAGLDFADLADRARSQHAAVEECRRQAVVLAFAA